MTVEAKVAIAADNAQLLRVLTESKSAMKEFFETATEEGAGFGASLEDIQSKFKAAFEFTGLAFATEAVHKFGEMLEHLGEQALQLRTVSSVLDVTTDQLQAMRESAEEAGVGADTLTHAGERLVSLLTEARNGSSAAADKLLMLGMSSQQLADPTFKLNNLIQILHDRLEDSSTSQDTMNQLMLILGNRAALAAQAFKEYDGSAEGVQRVIDRINGLTTEQIERLGKASRSWAEVGTTAENTFTKLMLGSKAMDTSGMSALSMSNAGSAKLAQSSVDSQNPFAGLSEQAGKAAEGAAEEMARAARVAETQWTVIQNEMNLQELENIKVGVTAYQEGSAQRVAALQREYDFAQQVYGPAQLDKINAIQTQLIASQRAYADAQVQASRLAQQAEDEHVARTLRGITTKIEANGRYFAEQQQQADAIRSFDDTKLEMDKKIAQERLKLSQQSRAIDERERQEFYQKWAGLSNAIEGSFSGAISGMLQGTMTFAGALQSIFSSIVDSLIQMFVKMAVQWAEGLLYQEIAQKATAISAITANSGIAATAAMASVAAIPFYGWAMAPEVGATTFAEGLSYLASASAAGGFDVPTGQNPVTQLHAREMVLPQSLADPIRDMASGGRRGGPGAAIPFKKMGDHMVIHMGNLKDALKSLGYQFKLS